MDNKKTGREECNYESAADEKSSSEAEPVVIPAERWQRMKAMHLVDMMQYESLINRMAQREDEEMGREESDYQSATDEKSSSDKVIELLIIGVA